MEHEIIPMNSSNRNLVNPTKIGSSQEVSQGSRLQLFKNNVQKFTGSQKIGSHNYGKQKSDIEMEGDSTLKLSNSHKFRPSVSSKKYSESKIVGLDITNKPVDLNTLDLKTDKDQIKDGRELLNMLSTKLKSQVDLMKRNTMTSQNSVPADLIVKKKNTNTSDGLGKKEAEIGNFNAKLKTMVYNRIVSPDINNKKLGDLISNTF